MAAETGGLFADVVGEGPAMVTGSELVDERAHGFDPWALFPLFVPAA